MNAILKLTYTDLKILLRNPVAIFFTLPFPILVLVVFGSIFGNAPIPQAGNLGQVDIMVPALFAIIIGTAALMNLPIALASRREKGILRRFRATPLPPFSVIVSAILVNLLVALIGALALVASAKFLYDLQLPSNPLEIFMAFLYSAVAFFAISFVIASLAPNSDAARSIGMALYFPMMFISGAAFPRFLFPETVKQVSDLLPMTQIVLLVQDLWFGHDWNVTAILFLGALMVIGAIIAVKTFRWE